MGVRRSARDRGTDRGRRLLERTLSEIEAARLEHGLSATEIGRAIRLSPSQVSRTLHSRPADVGLIRLSQLAASVGLELSSRAYPAGPPIRDRAQLALLGRLRARLGSLCSVFYERPVVEIPAPGAPGAPDLRAWDLAIEGPGWLACVEAETRLADVQSVQRRIALKQRDGVVPVVILLVSDTRHNRSVVAASELGLRQQFPVSARSALHRLAASKSPDRNALILL